MTVRPHNTKHFTVHEGVNQRLDLWLGQQLRVSRSQIKRLIDQELVTVNGTTTKAGYKVQAGDELVVNIPQEQTPSLEAEPIPLHILYEDEELAVIEKPKGLVVHPGAGNLDGTLVNALLYHIEELAEGGEPERPGIVHRLDKDTSGLMMVAKTEASFAYLSNLLKERQVERHYLALVQGRVAQDEGVIDKPIGRHPKDRKKMAVLPSGRDAQTIFTVIERFTKHSLVRCELVTGRTHQIRVHCASMHHPIVGDPLYGWKKNNLGADSQMLHAAYLAFRHPRGERLEFNSDPGAEFWDVVEKAKHLH